MFSSTSGVPVPVAALDHIAWWLERLVWPCRYHRRITSSDTRPQAAPTWALEATSGHRRDLDGLRAVAVLLVVAAHVELPGLHGGVVGVDVFFVISGYLITRSLWSEWLRTGTIGLGRFWARRVRRLVPALALMVVTVLALSLALLPALRIPSVVRDGSAAMVYVSNLLFATELTSPLPGDVSASPFLHTWSLGVEEQFYVLWPLLLLAAAAVAARRWPGRAPRVLAAALAIVLVVSFGLSLDLSGEGSAWAHFGLRSRAWQFALGGLVGLVAQGAWRRPSGRGLLLSGTGLMLVLLAATVVQDALPYPAPSALPAVVGVAALLVVGAPWLAWAPLCWLGQRSYSWYLWHWPIIVLAAAVAGDALPVRLGAAALSLAVAVVAHDLVEEPLRHGSRLGTSRRRTFVVGVALTAGALLVGVAVDQAAERRYTPLDEQLVVARDDREPPPCPVERRTATGIRYCEGGRTDASRTVMLVGDSHAGQWSAALERAADAAGIRLVHRWRRACPALDVDLAPRRGPADPDGCAEHRARTAQAIEELEVDAVVFAHGSSYRLPTGDAPPDTRVGERWEHALRHRVERLLDVGIGVGVIRDNPRLPGDPIDCMARLRSPEACATSPEEALDPTSALRQARAEVVADLGVPAFTTVPDICEGEVCRLEVDGTLVFADASHLTRAYTERQEPRLRRFLLDALPDGR